MHELSVATELYLGLRAEVTARGGGRLLRAEIAVGELAGVDPALLRFAWEAVVAGGPDGGARLDIDWRCATVTCPDCGPVADPPAGSWLRPCPTCSAPLLVEGGLELDVLALVHEAPDDGRPDAPETLAPRRPPAGARTETAT